MAVAEKENFSQAAESLFVTQSALSQRVKNLEMELGQTLFIRESGGVRLTESGQRLLVYTRSKNLLEQEVLSEMADTSSGLAGSIRIAAFSSVMRSVVIKSLSPILRKHPEIQCEFKVAEMSELPSMLRRGEADMVILDYPLEKPGIVQEPLGTETYVLVESAKHKTNKDIFLDHNPEDTATELFFSSQKTKPKKLERSFMGEVYGIIDGVAEGLGRAVLSKHLIQGRKDLKIVRGMKPHKRKVTLHYYEQSFYTRLFKRIEEELINRSSLYLE